jgi:predicted methyltransferase
MRLRFFLTCLALLAAGCASQSEHVPGHDCETAAALDRILAAPHRSEANRARDVYRHPKETLLFFGIRPDMTVVEVWPGGGWYTEILAPLLRERGRFYAAHVDPSVSDNAKRAVERFQAKLASAPEIYDKVIVTSLAPGGRSEIAPPGSADLVVTFRNLHNWMMSGWEREAIAAMHAALKPGGILGIVEHRGNPNVPQDPKAATGYVNEAYAIELIESLGFELVERSEINANPRDVKNYEKGVWTLPPTFAAGDQDRERYAQIGESDRFTLKFRKIAQ